MTESLASLGDQMDNIPMRIERMHLVAGYEPIPGEIIEWVIGSPFDGKPGPDPDDVYSEEEDIEHWMKNTCQGHYFIEIGTPDKKRIGKSRGSAFSWGFYTSKHFHGPHFINVLKEAIAWAESYDGGLKAKPKRKKR